MNFKIIVDQSDTQVGASYFGNDPGLQGLVPLPGKLPAHLVLTIDTSDPAVPDLNLGIGPIIRLVHPFYYSQGGCFAYHHRGGGEIEFVKFSGEADGTWPTNNFPASLPTRAISFHPTSSDEERKFGDASTIFVGPNSPTAQDHSGLRCVACGKGDLQLLGSVPSRPISEIDIWDNDFVFVLFWLCPSCKAINTHNECD